MENEENKILEENTSSTVNYVAGEEAKDSKGNDVDASGFTFVQQDKSIHDTKFTTRPTTFMKDAMKRFMKNKSSVIGGAILGVLFVLALILPITMVSVDTTERHDYETHLPMKLFPAGTGFWDGTRTSSNAAYPYEVDADNNYADVLDESGNRIRTATSLESYPDEGSIVKVANKQTKYLDQASSDAFGGYAKLEEEAHPDGVSYGMMYSAAMSYDFTQYDYTLTYALGTYDQEGYENPEFAILMHTAGGDYHFVSALSSDYGAALTKNDGARVTPHEEITVNLNQLVSLSGYMSATYSQEVSFGLAFEASSSSKTALYVQKFGITTESSGAKASYKRQLANRSFGTDGATVEDANSMVNQPKENSGKANQSYWTSEADKRFDCFDPVAIRADVTYDMYAITYGLRNNITVAQSKFQEWIDAGLITYTDFADKSTFQITETGAKSTKMYVTEIQSVAANDTTGTVAYTMTCQVMMYKYLGYDAVPLHLLGTEYQGKDLLKYVFEGLRTSLILGVVVSIINIIIGIIWGSISGYFGGMVDITMERITDVLGGIPWIVLMTVLTIKFGQTFVIFGLALCLTGWIGTASTTRSQFYRYRDREYVLAAKTLGSRPGRLIFRHILPNAIGTIVTRSVLMIPSTIFSEATISYLGLGLTNLASLGVILTKSQNAMTQGYYSELVVPAVIISLLMICFNLFGNGLRDAFNPSLKGTD